ncbi:MAG TPA: hypothetical protein VHI13_17040 [Candidatus Kapabacteria bacterium]|nr:hypothetical protein [Candidatus Kapabacteria bacterium]
MATDSKASQYTPIYKGRDFFVPAFEVKISGQDVPKKVLHDVIEVRYTDSVDKFDTFEITINNWDDVNRDFKYTGPHKGGQDPDGRDRLFDPGKEIEIWMGYFSPTDAASRDKDKPEPLRLMMAGIITKLAPTFPPAGQPTLKISGQNALVKMIAKQNTHTYKAGLKDSQIAKQIGDSGALKIGNMKIGVKTNPQAMQSETENVQPVIQTNQYDILFLLQLAKKNDYDIYLDKEESGGNTNLFLNFGPSGKESTKYLLEWGKSLTQFQPTLTTMRQVKELTVRGWDMNAKKPIKETVKRSDIKPRGMSDLDRLYELEQGFSEKSEIVVNEPFHSPAEARKRAEDLMKNLNKSLVKAKGATIGTPDLHAGRRIYVAGLGQTFEGEYFLTSTTHTIGANGYTTDFDARMEET